MLLKKIVAPLLLACCSVVAYSQPLPDSVLSKYKLAKTDEEKGRCLFAYYGVLSKTDSSIIKNTLDLVSWFKTKNDKVGEDYTNLRLTHILTSKGDFTAALKMCFDILPRFEKRNDTFGILCSNRAISGVYFLSKDYEQAAIYDKKALALMSEEKDGKANISRMHNAIGCIYGEGGIPDSGMVYAQKAVNMDMELKNYQQMALSISTLAENYIAAKEYEIALPFLRKSLNYYESKQAKATPYLYAYLMNDFAQVFLATQQYDSANYYAHRALDLSIPGGYKDQNMRSYEFLYKSFEETKHQDSVNIYFRLAMTTKDSLFSIEKAKSLEALRFREQIRQEELETEKIKAEEERQENIQYAFIAFGIVSFVIIFLLLSRSYITNTKLIEFFGVLALLIVFEFLNLLLHPFLERITHHSPLLMLVALVALASLLIPLHHRLEKWTTKILVEKNKAIRLANAKKTIEKLEDK